MEPTRGKEEAAGRMVKDAVPDRGTCKQSSLVKST
jgi:hypothetical protein